MRAERTPDGTCFDVSGKPDAPVVVLIHGLGLCRELWSQHLPALESHFRVVNYDLYGHGDSEPLPGPNESGDPPKDEQKTTLSIYSRQIARLLDHLGIKRAAIVGFSIGGMINRRFAMDFPERVTSLVILNSPHQRGEQLQEQVEARAKQVGTGDPMATLADALVRWFTPGYLDKRDNPLPGANSADGVERVTLWRNQVDPRSYAGAAWVLANGVRELVRPKVRITCSTLVLTCENDSGSTAAMSEAIAAEITGSELILLPTLQHLGLLENPEAFTTPVVEFLQRHLYQR